MQISAIIKSIKKVCMHGLLKASASRGNIVLADHGQTIAREPLGTVPAPTLFQLLPPDCDRCHPRDPKPIFPRFRPTLAQAPLTFAVPYNLKPLFGFEPDPDDRSDLNGKTLPRRFNARARQIPHPG